MNLDELRQRATKFMQMEELREFQNQVRVDGGIEISLMRGKEDISIEGQKKNLVVENFNNTRR